MHNFIYTQTLRVNFRGVLAKCSSNALDNIDFVKFTSSRRDNSATNDSMVMKIAHAELYTTNNIVCNFDFSTCNTVGLFLWTTIIQYNLQVQEKIIPQPMILMVMKIAHAQLHMYTNITYKFQSTPCKTVGEKLRTKLCP